ncbi:MAG: alpha/beta fold hydrolase, partial [Bacteroidia bacterium]
TKTNTTATQEQAPVNPIAAKINDSTKKNKDSVIITKGGKLTYTEAYNNALALWKVPFEEKDIKTSLGTAHVIISGPANGEPLILLHGMNASSTMWYPNIKDFSKNNRVYAIDFLLEPGKSLCESEINSTDQIVDWYYEIFKSLNLKKFSIVGASRGGWLAINLALHSPSSVNKIALLSPAQAFIWIRPEYKFLSNIVYSVSPKRKRLRSVLETMTYNVDKLDQIYIDQYFIGTEKATMNKCILQMTPFSDKQLKSLQMPVLVLIGDNDIINNNKSLRIAKEDIRHVETATIKNAGHFLSIDQPEIVDKKVLDFLNEDKSSAKNNR